MKPTYNRNGVKNRMDGKGDDFAELHRHHTRQDCYMYDADALLCESNGEVHLLNGEDRAFFETVFVQKYGKPPKVHFVCIFDRKFKRAIPRDYEVLNLQGGEIFYLEFARVASLLQAEPCRFFHVYGRMYPFYMIEFSLVTGKPCMKTPWRIDEDCDFEFLWTIGGVYKRRDVLKQDFKARDQQARQEIMERKKCRPAAVNQENLL